MRALRFGVTVVALAMQESPLGGLATYWSAGSKLDEPIAKQYFEKTAIGTVVMVQTDSARGANYIFAWRTRPEVIVTPIPDLCNLHPREFGMHEKAARQVFKTVITQVKKGS